MTVSSADVANKLRDEVERLNEAVNVLAEKSVRHFEWENMMAVQQGENRIELPMTGNEIADAALTAIQRARMEA